MALNGSIVLNIYHHLKTKYFFALSPLTQGDERPIPTGRARQCSKGERPIPQGRVRQCSKGERPIPQGRVRQCSKGENGVSRKKTALAEKKRR